MMAKIKATIIRPALWVEARSKGRSFLRTHSRLPTAPQATARPIWVYERDGKRHAALFHKGQWMKVVRFPRDPHSGQARVAMDGTTVSNPIAWACS